MEKRMRSSDVGGGNLVKKRSSSGCLIVRKKSDGIGVGSSGGSRDAFMSKEKKRSRIIMSDSGSSDELLEPYRRRVGPGTDNGGSVHRKTTLGKNENFGGTKDRSDQINSVKFGRDEKAEGERKRSRLDVFEFDEYDAIDGKMMRQEHGSKVGGIRLLGTKIHVGNKSQVEPLVAGSSRHFAGIDKRRHSYYDGASSTFGDGKRGSDRLKKNRFELKGEGSWLSVSMLKERYKDSSDKPIRVQGKNGVLKVMVKNKKKDSVSLKAFNHQDIHENRKGFRPGTSIKKDMLVHTSFRSETKLPESSGTLVKKDKHQMKLRKSLPTKSGKVPEWETDESDMSMKMGDENEGAHKSMKQVKSEDEKTPTSEKSPMSRSKEGKIRRGSGTEKQLLRDQIRKMLVSAGWTIDYRPRRNRDYQDAVYVNPSGTAYWSIIKAYDALLKQLEEEGGDIAPNGDGSFTPISDDVLSKLTRQTRKKMEHEMSKKHKVEGGNKVGREAATRKSLNGRSAIESLGMTREDEGSGSIRRQSSKALKSKMTENSSAMTTAGIDESQNFTRGINGENYADGAKWHGRNSRKLGRCTLLVRGSKKGLGLETDDFIPYAGKRTLLSWLIDSRTVQSSEKVQYMNRKRTRAMLEGWVTRDGIHCGCCSKILTVSKFEIHAGSKLRQPFQNIFLESGVSLLQCQLDSWNRQSESERSGFYNVDVDGDDPNDDTCGICGDGGDLICCDSCPSTFHQSCLGIQMLPPGDWHCPNCSCKYCGIAGQSMDDDDPVSSLLQCNQCEKKFHPSCMNGMDAPATDSSSSATYFCGQTCQEIYEHLQKILGVKHELEAGFSWSLIHRTDLDSDASLRGFPLRVECNSKLAVALSVMDECFLPIVDRRSGINLIHNVLYNCGSNFNRLNFSGFYTAILERGDEIISAASIRIRGTQLAEMPFIGTRHIYRRQGMCRRLFCAIKSALCSLKVEKLIIPAISETTDTWTVAFGFKPLEESDKQQMRSLNMLVFPGTDMLQKVFREAETLEGNQMEFSCEKPRKVESTDGVTPEVEDKQEVDSSVTPDRNVCGDIAIQNAKEEVVAADSNFETPVLPENESFIPKGDTENKLDVSSSIASDLNMCDDAAPQHVDEIKVEVVTNNSSFETPVPPINDKCVPGGEKPNKVESVHCITPGIENKSADNISAAPGLNVCDEVAPQDMEETEDKVGTASSSLDAPVLPLNDTSVPVGEKLTKVESVRGTPEVVNKADVAPSKVEKVCGKIPKVENKSDVDFSGAPDLNVGDDIALQDVKWTEEEVVDAKLSLDAPVFSVNDAPIPSSSLEDHCGKVQVSDEGAVCSHTWLADKLVESTSDPNCQTPATTRGVDAQDIRTEDAVTADSLQTAVLSVDDTSYSCERLRVSDEVTVCTGSQLTEEPAESASDPSAGSCDVEMEDKPTEVVITDSCSHTLVLPVTDASVPSNSSLQTPVLPMSDTAVPSDSLEACCGRPQLSDVGTLDSDSRLEDTIAESALEPQLHLPASCDVEMEEKQKDSSSQAPVLHANDQGKSHPVRSEVK
ncbi:Tify domain binding domain [Dillenia turbinata]|uniref:Tify domain binding domain n=1 Tax=Dillenia turbinata TaxID=194707 RepID=A0AAN8V7S5_9MAGN